MKIHKRLLFVFQENVNKGVQELGFFIMPDSKKTQNTSECLKSG